ncbi:MAG: amino acid ABC transporter ATP-binding protein [Lachnospiraceae bacterium]|nr:amino acid ABC transporter ATP-binding protein [Lachnospiraceae bacterium]
MIEVRNLRKEYDNVTPLKDVNTVIRDGDVIAIIGPSGTGKSTFLRCLNLLEQPTGGQIIVNGEDITSKNCNINLVRQKMGMVFQSFNLFGHQTIIENIMYAPVKRLGMSKQEAYDKGMELLKTVGLAQKAMNYPDELSGGQKQRVAIARALAMDPDTLLFDEPTSALDPTMVGEVQAVIRELAKSGKTLLIVTHEMAFARQISNRVFFMDEGGIYEDGTPEQIFENPQRENTIRFIRKLKVLTLDIDSKDYDFPAANNEIENFCYRSGIVKAECMKMQAVAEELCQHILLSELDNPKIQMTAEYSAASNETVVTVKYNGKAFDPATTMDELAYKVLLGRIKSLQYEQTEGAYTNLVKITL